MAIRWGIVKTAGTTRVSFLAALKEGPRDLAWAEFHTRYGELLYRYARGRGASDAEAEDVTQEVEMYLFKAMGQFEYDPKKGGFRSYLRRSVVNAVGRRASRRSRQEASVDPAVLALMSGGQPEEDPRWEREWRLHQLRWLLRSIADDFEPITMEAFRLHVLADRPVDEVADHLRISRASVYQAKSRVIRQLRDQLGRIRADDEDWPPTGSSACA